MDITSSANRLPHNNLSKAPKAQRSSEKHSIEETIKTKVCHTFHCLPSPDFGGSHNVPTSSAWFLNPDPYSPLSCTSLLHHRNAVGRDIKKSFRP
ncbi:hypothetical protein PAXRUDRAFT_831183 [Paxillus rubicundulus Ve08.2h10]|uniref:Uncharacterized protein n=1 Tax=Paxillus rubicundulus Ve08.2h10 TaxID=930991 RepID=A0A0D0E2I9_9AGAM|nr:hypothetical protein PAXRUDRAFT_831183 [Paxillus rubicundulus Ve08.2h10]